MIRSSGHWQIAFPCVANPNVTPLTIPRPRVIQRKCRGNVPARMPPFPFKPTRLDVRQPIDYSATSSVEESGVGLQVR